MKRASLQENIVALYLLQISNYLIPLITLPYLVRTLGAERYGLISFSYALTYFMVLFVDAGYNLTASRELSALTNLKTEQTKAREIFWSTQILKSIMVLGCALVMGSLILLFPSLKKEWAVYLLSFLTVLGSLAFPVWVFQGFEQMRFTTLLFLGGRLLAAIGILVFVNDTNDYVLAAFLQSGSTLFSGILAWPVLQNKFQLYWLWPGKKALIEHYKHGRSYFFADFISTALNNSSVFIIGLFQTKELVGVFAAIEKLARAMASMFAPIQKAFFPRVTASYQVQMAEGQNIAERLVKLLGATAGLGAIFVIIFAPWILHLVFGNKFSDYADLLRILAIWFAFMVVNGAMSEFGFVARRRTAELNHCQHLASIILLIGVPLAAACLQQFVLEAVAAVMLLSQLILSILLWRSWHKQKYADLLLDNRSPL